MRERLRKRIVRKAGILGGKPVVRGTRISVEFVLGLLSKGMTIEGILSEYPHLSKEDILACLGYAEEMVKHEELIVPGLSA